MAKNVPIIIFNLILWTFFPTLSSFPAFGSFEQGMNKHDWNKVYKFANIILNHTRVEI